MKFIMTEDALGRLATWGYRGVIGLFWNNTFGGLLAYLLFGIIAILALIGAITVFKWILVGLPKKKKY